MSFSNVNPSSTKKGPGRKHAQGIKKAGAPKPPSAGMGFVQHTNPSRAKRRALITCHGGIRRFKRMTQKRYWNDIPF